jgi:hypothetical protein
MEVDFSAPYLESLVEPASPNGVPQVWPISIAGRTYVVNTSFEPYRRDAFRHRSIQPQRQSIDLTNVPGEGTVNTEGLWRRAAVDWRYGSGQQYFDRKGSAENRYLDSKGIDPWTPWQTSLLTDTKPVIASTGATQVMQVGKYIYVLDIAAKTLKFTSDLSTWSASVTTIGTNPAMLATDGYNIWIADNTFGGGIWTTTAGAAAATQYVTNGQWQGVYWVGERLMATSSNGVYNIIAGGVFPTPLWGHPNPQWRVTAMCAGSSQIYFGGYDPGQGSPLKSTVFRSSIEPNGTALTVPVQALPMAGGEYVTALSSYLNYVFVGTNLGVRMCRTLAAYDPSGAAGDLEAGPALPNLIAPGPVPLPVKAMIANNRFMYFGWSNYDASSTGLGRMDLSAFIDAQTPAYASDMMVAGQGEVVSMDWCTINNQPIWSVSGQGVYTSSGTYVPSGYVDSGFVSYGIPDDKVLMAGDIGTISPQEGTVIMGIGTDANNNVVQAVGQQNSSSSGGTSNQSVFPIAQIRGEQYVVRMTLVRDPITSKSPILHRWTIKALPAITAGTTISVVLDLFGVTNNAGQDTYIDPYAEKAFLENIRKAQLVVPYVEGPYSTLATIEEIDWLPFKQRDATTEGGYQGDCIVYLKTWDIGS